MRIVMRNLIYCCSLDNHKIDSLLAGVCFYVGFLVTDRRTFYVAWKLHIFCNIEFWPGRRSTYVRCGLADTRGLRPCWYNPRWNNPYNCTFDNRHPRDSFFADSMAQHTRKISYLSRCVCICDNSTCNVLIKIHAKLGFTPLLGLGKAIDTRADSLINKYIWSIYKAGISFEFDLVNYRVPSNLKFIQISLCYFWQGNFSFKNHKT